MGDTELEPDGVERTARDLTRRDFLRSAAAATGAGLAVGAAQIVRAETRAAHPIQLALIGAGTQGRWLLANCVKIAGVRFKAVCDIWPYNSGRAVRMLGKYGHQATEYADYREMLAKEKDLDAVIVASPDWVHAEQSIACLKAGKHVYCEKEMSNDLGQAAEMVRTARRTGKLLQIGHQRRSNARYHLLLDYVNRLRACGRITNVSGCWNRSKPLTVPLLGKAALDQAALREYGYDTMDRLLNWRWYRRFSGGPIADLGSHQMDIFHWVLGTPPKSVMACGGNENYPKMEWYDNVTAIYEWDYPWQGQRRTVRGYYELLSTTSNGGYRESFMGTEGAITMSEELGKGGIRREPDAPVAEWEGPLYQTWPEKERERMEAEAVIRMLDLPAPARYYPPLPGPKEPTTEHMPHLMNFFDAIGGKAKLNCPGEVGYETAVSILRVNDAVAAGRKLTFQPEEFKV
jgi:predicted dehydrogenase